MNIEKLPQVVIVGAGFGGMEVARQMAHAPVQITLIDRHNYHLFQPLLYQVAVAGLLPSQIAHPLRTIFRNQKNISFQMGEVIDIDLDAHYVRIEGSVIAYDYLVLAMGGQTNFFGLDEVEQNAFQLKDINSAIATRNHLLSMFEEASQEGDADRRRALLTFAVVGGGPTGVETAGALAELIQHVMVKDYPHLHLKDARVLLIEATSHLIASYPDELRHATRRLLEKKQVEILTETQLAGYDGHVITLANGEHIQAETLIWTAGVKAAASLSHFGLEQASAGRVRVEPTLQVPQHPEVFVVGDAAYCVDKNGRPLPMLSTVALQQGKTAAHNIRQQMSGTPMRAFQYKDPGLLATIGRNAAVARIWGISFSGFIAWVIWVFLHIYRLIGFRNRVLVLLNWAWDYIFYENQVRLITRE